MARKKKTETLVTKVEHKKWHFKLSDADGFAIIHVVDQHGNAAPKGLAVADGIIESATAGRFVFAGSAREAAARLAAIGFVQL